MTMCAIKENQMGQHNIGWALQQMRQCVEAEALRRRAPRVEQAPRAIPRHNETAVQEDVQMSDELDLPAIAASVARALGLRERLCMGEDTWQDDVDILWLDGRNLESSHWRCRCLDWIHDQGYDVMISATKSGGGHGNHGALLNDGHKVLRTVRCPTTLAPAALVHEVVRWRDENGSKA